jgi:hypothetical protein
MLLALSKSKDIIKVHSLQNLFIVNGIDEFLGCGVEEGG